MRWQQRRVNNTIRPRSNGQSEHCLLLRIYYLFPFPACPHAFIFPTPPLFDPPFVFLNSSPTPSPAINLSPVDLNKIHSFDVRSDTIFFYVAKKLPYTGKAFHRPRHHVITNHKGWAPLIFRLPSAIPRYHTQFKLLWSRSVIATIRLEAVLVLRR